MSESVVAPRSAVMGAGIALLVSCAFFTLSIFYSMPSNVLAVREGESIRRFMVAFAPQTWAFFTKDPSAEEVEPYGITLDGLEPLLAFPQATSGNPFGLSRTQRAQGVELGILASQVAEWEECADGAGSACRERVASADPVVVTNGSAVATVCGEAVLVQSKPVPWAYRHSYGTTRFDERAARVDVRCVDATG